MIRVLRVGEMPSKKFPGRGLACYVLSKNKKLKTTLFTPYQCFNDSLIPLKFKNLTLRKYLLLKNRNAQKLSNSAKKIKTFLNLFVYFFANIQILIREVFNTYDVVHIHNPAYSPLFIFAKFRGSICSYTAHGYDSFIVSNSFLLKIFLQKVDIIFCMAESQVNQFKKIFPKKKIIFASNGVDFELFNNEKKYQERKKNIICIGSLTWKKDYATIIKSFFEISKKIKNWKLIIIGIGPELRNLKNLITLYNLESKVILRGNLSRKDVATELRESRIYLINSITEGLPKSLIEAMASGCACISSDVGECKNVLKKCGIIIQHKNVMETTNALLKLINDDKISEIYSEKSKKIAKNYSWENYSNIQINAYKELLNLKK